MTAKKGLVVPPPVTPPIVVPKDAALDVSDAVRAGWDKTVESFANPQVKAAYAIKFSQYILVRLDHLARNTTSPKVLQDVARIAKDYVEFAFRAPKD